MRRGRSPRRAAAAVPAGGQEPACRLKPASPRGRSYLKGKYYWNQRSEAGLLRAIGYFKQSIADAPGDPQAYAGLAETWIVQGILGFRPASEVFPQGKSVAVTLSDFRVWPSS